MRDDLLRPDDILWAASFRTGRRQVRQVGTTRGVDLNIYVALFPVRARIFYALSNVQQPATAPPPPPPPPPPGEGGGGQYTPGAVISAASVTVALTERKLRRWAGLASP